MGPHGELDIKGAPIYADPNQKELGLIGHQKLPLCGQINTNKYQGITVLENKMYNAPCFYHTAERNDFFCTVFQGKQVTSQKRIIIRELDNIYTVGQIEPKMEVHNPTSRQFQTFLKTRAKAYITMLLMEN